MGKTPEEIAEIVGIDQSRVLSTIEAAKAGELSPKLGDRAVTAVMLNWKTVHDSLYKDIDGLKFEQKLQLGDYALQHLERVHVLSPDHVRVE